MKRHIQKVMPRNRIGRSVLILMSGTAAGQLIVIAAMPIITRLFTPEMFGVLSLYHSFINLFVPVIAWRYESALLVAESEGESFHLLRLGYVIVLVMAVSAAPIMFTMIERDIMGYGVVPKWTPLLVTFSLVGLGAFSINRSWILRLRSVGVLSVATISRSTTGVAAKVVAGLSGLGAYGLIVSEALGAWAAVGTLRARRKIIINGTVPKWSLEKLIEVGGKYRKFAKYEMPSMIINHLALVLPVPIIAYTYGARAAGIFGVARMLLALPGRQVGNAAADVFQMELAKLVRGGKGGAGGKLFYSFSIKLSILAVMMYVAILILAEPLVPYVFGDEWAEMGAVLKKMAPWVCSALVVSAMSRSLSVLRKQEWKMLYDITALTLVVSSYYYAQSKSTSFEDYVYYLALAMMAAYFLYFTIIAIVFRVEFAKLKVSEKMSNFDSN